MKYQATLLEAIESFTLERQDDELFYILYGISKQDSMNQ